MTSGPFASGIPDDAEFFVLTFEDHTDIVARLNGSFAEQDLGAARKSP